MLHQTYPYAWIFPVGWIFPVTVDLPGGADLEGAVVADREVGAAAGGLAAA